MTAATPETPSLAAGSKRPRTRCHVQTILDWPTDTVSVDYYDRAPTTNNDSAEYPQTLLLFCPGNPGCVAWYVPMLEALVENLGVGFAARGVSYAGHGTNPDIVCVEDWEDRGGRDTHIPWTVNGQIDHKIAWMDMVLQQMEDIGKLWTKQGIPSERPKLVFITHSIGAHMIQRLLIQRPDILQMTLDVIHLMPFMRMDAPQPQHAFLSTVAQSPKMTIAMARGLSRAWSMLPEPWLSFMMRKSVPDEKDRQLAMYLVRQPEFARNFFELGCEEIRDVPELPDVWAFRLIGNHCPTHILFCGGPDHWSPPFHMQDIEELQRQGCIPKNVHCTYMKDLRHAFVVYPDMVPAVVDYLLKCISMEPNVRSRL